MARVGEGGRPFYALHWLDDVQRSALAQMVWYVYT